MHVLSLVKTCFLPTMQPDRQLSCQRLRCMYPEVTRVVLAHFFLTLPFQIFYFKFHAARPAVTKGFIYKCTQTFKNL